MDLNDPLDSENFDSVLYINQKFPTEASLDDLDTFIFGIGSQISILDEEISKAVQTQSVIGKQASKDIIETQSSIADLFQKIHDIKLKASQSERMVQEICADIKKLDYAKNHLQTSITSLNRLQMLINAVEQLELLAKDHSYREVANLLDAVKQFMTHFDQYVHIPVIYDLETRVAIIREGLIDHIASIFKHLAQAVDTVADAELVVQELGISGGLRAVTDSCMVIDSLGSSARKLILEEFVQLQLIPYENLFGQQKQHFSLDQVDRRWSWFKRLLKYIDNKFGTIFPMHWRLPLRLCLEFTERTKIHLVLLLTELESHDDSNNSHNSSSSHSSSSGGMDVHALLKALQSALRFEQEMSERFNLSAELAMYEQLQLRQEQLQQQQQQHSSSTSSAGLTSVSRKAQQRLSIEDKKAENRTHLRLKHDDKLMYIPTDHDAINQEDETESGFLHLANTAIAGGISNVFDKFLGSYVLLERQNLEDMLLRLSQEEDTTSSSSSAAAGMGIEGNSSSSGSSHIGNVYGSSTSMFVFIKNAVKRCTALTKGQTFLTLCKEFKTCMIQYVELLRNRCPPAITVTNSSSSATTNMISNTISNSIGSSSSSSNNTIVYRLPLGGEVSMCYLINTGEYCAEVVPQLEQMIQQKMDNESLASKVNFDTEVDAFLDFVAHGIKVLVSGTMDRLDASFRAMQSIHWGSATQVGEESAYLHTFNAVIVDMIPKIRSSLSASYFNNVCTKVASEALQRYLDIILSQKRISEEATQQLLLDTYNLKSVLIQMPQLTSTNTATGSNNSTTTAAKPTSPMYLKLVNAKISHIEIVLKLVGTPEEMLLERFRIMWPDGQPSDLQLLMSLKGTKRNDQQVILEMLGLSAAGKMLNKTAHSLLDVAAQATNTTANTIGSSSSNSAATGHLHSSTSIGGSNSVYSSTTSSSSSSSYSAASAAAASAAAMASSSMKSLTLDISSSARNAVGNLKWSTSGQKHN